MFHKTLLRNITNIINLTDHFLVIVQLVNILLRHVNHLELKAFHERGIKEKGQFYCILKPLLTCKISRLEQIASDLDAFSKSIINPNTTVLVDQILMAFLTTCQKGSTFRIGRVQDLYNQMIPVLVKITTKQPDLYNKASNISKQLVALEVIPEAWKQTQFWHVANFPVEQW